MSWAEFQDRLRTLYRMGVVTSHPDAAVNASTTLAREISERSKSSSALIDGTVPRVSDLLCLEDEQDPMSIGLITLRTSHPRPKEVSVSGLSDAEVPNAVVALRDLHEEYLRRAQNRCFLGEKTESVQAIVNPIFSLCLQYRNLVCILVWCCEDG